MQTRLHTVLTLALLVLTACSPGAAGTAPTLNATEIVATAVANVNATMTAMAVVQPPPALPPASSTATLAIVEPPTSTPLPVATATLPGIRVSVSEETNCRMGPGTNYERVGGLKVGQSAEVVGRDQASQHFYIRLPDNPAVFCWIISYYATVTGNIASVVVMTPPPTTTASVTATPAMDFTVAYSGLDQCTNWFLEFSIVNIGVTVLESVKIVTTDLTTPNTFTVTSDKFEDRKGCSTGTTQLDLVKGESEKANGGENIPYNPTGHNFEASITVCSANAQAGTCLTKKINFTP